VKYRTYRFQSNWEIKASKEKVWHIFTATPFSWAEWWPQIKNINNVVEKSSLKGSSFNCTWQALGYRLESNIVIRDAIHYEKIIMEFKSDGDLHGAALCKFHEKDGITQVYFDLQVKTTKKWMNYFEPILRPLFIVNHHHIMNSGKRGLRNYLRDTQS
jgi:hypothetical protein